MAPASPASFALGAVSCVAVGVALVLLAHHSLRRGRRRRAVVAAFAGSTLCLVGGALSGTCLVIVARLHGWTLP